MSIINKNDILKVLISYNPWWKTNEVPTNTIKDMKRTAFYEAKKAFNNKEIRRYVLLTGARRVGKTTILYQLIDELIKSGVESKDILYVSFDNPILKFCKLNELLDLYEVNLSGDGTKYLFFDEIQYAEDWNNWLKVLYDQNPNSHVMATGSASPVITEGVVESGTGRWVTITVPTLSFYEYCKLVAEKGTPVTAEDIDGLSVDQINILLTGQFFNHNKKTELSGLDEKLPKDFTIENLKNIKEKELGDVVNTLSILQKHFNRYIKIGGFPELVKSSDEAYAQKILREDIVDKVLKRDIPSLFNIRNINILEKVFLYLCFNTSNIINYTSMCKELDNTALATVQEYIRFLKNANLIYESTPIKGNILKSKPKVYIVDSAIRNAVLMKDDIITDPKEMGYSVETAVYRHVYTYMRKYNGNVGYYRDNKTEKEIDIIGNSVKENLYIEVKYREKTELNKENALYNIPNVDDYIYIVTKDALDYGIIKLKDGKTVIKIPAFAFLYILGRQEEKSNGVE